MKEMKVRLTLIEEILGTASGNKNIHADYIASKAPDAAKREEEIEAIGVDAEIEKSMTVFPRDNEGQPFIWDYQIRGFFKDACGMLRRVSKTKSSAMKAYKKIIDGSIFVKERQIPFDMVGEIGNCQRPLRGQTAQGERISLANSETIPSGSSITFTIQCLNDGDMETVKEWLNYGRVRGLGQWRNSGKGKFYWELLEEKTAGFDDFILAV